MPQSDYQRNQAKHKQMTTMNENPQPSQGGYRIPKKSDRGQDFDDMEVIKKKPKADGTRTQNPMSMQQNYPTQNYPMNQMQQSAMYDQRNMSGDMNPMHYGNYRQNDPRLNLQSPHNQPMGNYYPYGSRGKFNEEAQFSDDEDGMKGPKGGMPMQKYPYDQPQPIYDQGPGMAHMQSYSMQVMPQTRAPEKDKLREIVQLIQSSKDKKPQVTNQPPVMNAPVMKQEPPVEQQPTILLRKTSEFESGPVLIFKLLLQNLKRELPNCLKTKYQQRLRKIERLSNLLFE